MGYFDCILMLLSVPIKFALNQRAELGTRFWRTDRHTGNSRVGLRESLSLFGSSNGREGEKVKVRRSLASLVFQHSYPNI